MQLELTRARIVLRLRCHLKNGVVVSGGSILESGHGTAANAAVDRLYTGSAMARQRRAGIQVPYQIIR